MAVIRSETSRVLCSTLLLALVCFAETGAECANCHTEEEDAKEAGGTQAVFLQVIIVRGSKGDGWHGWLEYRHKDNAVQECK